MRIPVTVPVALSAGESRGSGVAHWVDGDRMLIRTRFALRTGQVVGFALIPIGFPDRIIGAIRVQGQDPEGDGRAPSWVCAIERLSPEMRSIFDRWSASLQPKPPPPPTPPEPASSLRFQAPPSLNADDEDDEDPDTAISDSTVARTLDSSANTDMQESEKVGRRALRGAVARSALGRRADAAHPSSGGGPLWLSDLDNRLRASGLDEAPAPPTRSPSNPFADGPTRLADESPWSGGVQPLGPEGDLSTEVAQSLPSEDEPTQVLDEPDEFSQPAFALITDEVIEESEQEATWSAVKPASEPDNDLLVFEADAPSGSGPPVDELPDPFADLLGGDDPFADLAGPPKADPFANADPFASADPFAPPAPKAAAPKAPEPAANDWLADMLSSSGGGAADLDALFNVPLPESKPARPEPAKPPPPDEEPFNDDFLPPDAIFEEDFGALSGEDEPLADVDDPDAEPEAYGGAAFLFEDEEPEAPPAPPRIEPDPPERAISEPGLPRSTAPHDVFFRYNAQQRMVEVSWRSPQAFARDQAEQLDNKMLRVWTSALAAEGAPITLKLALPDGQVLAMPAEVIGRFPEGFDLEIRMPKPAQQKLRRAAERI